MSGPNLFSIRSAGFCLAVGRWCLFSAVLSARPLGAATRIAHDVHTAHPLPSEEAANVRAIRVDGADTVWVATAAGVLRHAAASVGWQVVEPETLAGPSYDLAIGRSNSVWVGHWKGLAEFRGAQGDTTFVPGIEGPVRSLAMSADGRILAGGPRGFTLLGPDRIAQAVNLPACRALSAIVTDEPSGDWWMATSMGAYRWRPVAGSYVRGRWERDSFTVRDVLPLGDDRFWFATLGGLQEFHGTRLAGRPGPAHGFPAADLNCLARDPQGRIWVGSRSGVLRYVSGDWRIRRGRRWLIHDEVRDFAFDSQGTAWIATAGGVSALAQKEIAWEEKAGRFHAILEARHVRPPGIVEKCRLRVPGDLASWEPTDDDNDGGYTAVALAMESYRFAVTRSPEARAAARRAFAACELLQRLTETPGFLARTVIPAEWREMHDPNLTYSDAAWAEEIVVDPRHKRVPVRWRISRDGRWLWKGDTSSDEVTAHFFGYYLFHELAADTADRQRVRDQVCRIVDHLLEHGLTLTDADGHPTRWGVWAPERLNQDPAWEMERGINSLEILSFLKLAHHVSGEAKYDQAYRRLIAEHGYARNGLAAPNLNPTWRTYIDLELLAFTYPALLALEHEGGLRSLYQRSFRRWHEAVRPDANPLFEFLYAAYGSRSRADLSGAREFLARTPLDLINWDVDNASREDLRLVRFPEMEQLQTGRRLPVDEIGYSRTDQNPWLARQGDGGRTESDGVFWLLPYWMGRHHGFLRE